MQGCVPQLGCVLGLAVLFFTATVDAVEIPETWIDDAQLHDVQFIGSKIAIVVGEHGAIWKSSDAGQTWSRLNCGGDVSLRSVCFLTDQIGWVSGGDLKPYAGQDEGLLLSTTDGGKTWKRLGAGTFPNLNYLKFFDLEEGVVVGQPTPASRSGIFKTNDGGQSWQGVQGDAEHAWKAACFIEPQLGAVAGVSGKVSLMGGEQLFPSKLMARGYRSVRSIELLPNDSGWLAGDGGLVLKSDSGGVVWDVPGKELPEELRNGMDFRAIEVKGEKVWLAGSPGSVIWHSPDGGNSWIKQRTGSPAPISAVRFANAQLGVAVGAFGVVLRTTNGGQSWQAVRGDGRRAAILSLHARPSQTSTALLTKLSGESGYRSAVWIAQRNDLGPLAAATDGESRLQTAVQKSGGNAAEVHWQLPLTVPGIEFSSDKLLAEWQKQTEGRLPQTFLGSLVRQIRTWRPNIVILDQPSPDDAASQLLFDATLRAVQQAADPTRFAEQFELTGLAEWHVDRIYMRLAPGATGDAHVDLDEFLPGLKSSTRIAAGSNAALLTSSTTPQTTEPSRIAYRWIGFDGKPADDSRGSGNGKSSSKSRDFFGGLSISPGSAARRDANPFNDADVERMQKLVRKQRDFTAISHKMLDDPRMAGQMIGQLNGVIDGMDAQQAVAVLRELADEYRNRSQFELVEATYVELVRRYPQEPGALDAMRWLIQFWSSNETAWQRSRTMNSSATLSQTVRDNRAQFVDPALNESDREIGGIRQAVGSSERATQSIQGGAGSPARMTATLDFDDVPSRDKKSKSGRLKITAETDWRTGAIGEWQTRAIELARQLEKTSPKLYHSPEIQFPLAALRRTKGSSRASDEIMRWFVTNGIDAETRDLAQRELWTSFATPETPSALILCKRTKDVPHLDALLSDPCWEVANEISLSDKPVASGSAEADLDRPMMMLAYDDEFLYVALTVPRAEGTSRDRPQLPGRQHDADLSRHDRICIRLDVDRDYTTWYEFEIDQRGWTTESCWEDKRWNPEWYVAAEGDDTDWRIEAAIPWREMMPNKPRTGAIYGLSILRTIPTVGLQSWTQPAIASPKPSSFGFLKLD